VTTGAAGPAKRYAQAAFAVAREQRDMKGWREDLARLEELFADDDVVELFDNPRLDPGRRVALAVSIAPEDLKPERLNLLKLLVLSGRLGALAEVRRQFEALVAESENRLELEVVVAREPDEEDRSRIEKQLSARTGRRTTVEFRVDPSILGGIVIRQGDHVSDGSIRRRLEELTEQLISQ
jgi:F-type H+-transporting ATPase subunit delta